VTFLFTDIEGSTSRWEKDADWMRSALADHDAVLRSAIDCRLLCNPLAEGRAFRIETTIAHLREVLGDATYEVLARTGHAMTTTAMVSYAYEQARAMLAR
jgi:hypothetical protein